MSDPSDHPESPARVTELCVNLDDATGEVIGDACEALLAAGALDVWTTPIHMKKQRPGVMLSALCRGDTPEQTRPFAELILRLTGSFGVRMRPWDRVVLDRRFVEADTPLGEVTLKVGSLDGDAIVAQPEFASVQKLAERHGIPIRLAMSAAQSAADRWQRRDASGGTP
ncbi:MAG: nickel insertion protein [Planctomycetota bacterium]